ncbi:glycolipid 2-alpha-mannosyltransferase-domain-containing protein [Chiua virens]|nr:glycolipid 2-alpha-mannosyltransferase-domain-containing protein [Chiua virens]
MALPLTASQKRSILLAVTIVAGLCFLLGAGRGTSTLKLNQWNLQDKDITQPDVDNSPLETSSLSQVEAMSLAPQDTPPIPPEHLYVESKVMDDIEDTYESSPRRANATLLILARNSDLDGVVQSMEQVESKFNRKFNYPWVLLNDVEFSPEFKRRVSVLTNAPISFGVIPHEHWHQPDWIDEKRAREGRDRLVKQNIIYGGSVSYRNMCRFNSGFFFRHELLQQYKWYWRVEPDVRYFCDVDYDPFLFMEDKNKIYGFTISMPDWEPTIPTLWDSVREFIAEYPQYLHPDNSMEFLSDNSGETYNLCHFWSNFEIADMDFWRSEAYVKYFEFLEEKGGFYYERWGDAPVHSIAVSLFAGKDQIHFFKDIGYRHSPFQHCPQGSDWKKGHCSCDPNDNFVSPQFSPPLAKMMTPMRYVLLVLGIIVGLHYILSLTHRDYGNATSMSRLTDYIQGSGQAEPAPYREPVPDQYYKPPEAVYTPDRKANATFVMLVRNSDLPGIMNSMKQIEDRFNRKFNYPYVLLNDEPFTEDFKKYISALTNAEVEFGLIPKEDWVQPPSVDEEKASAAREAMVKQNVIYGGTYRNMCRFNSGFFYKQEVLQKYRYYWRVEYVLSSEGFAWIDDLCCRPDIKFFCDVDYDPFLLMQDQQKVYGFTISLFEYPATIPTLWQHVRAFINENPELIPVNNSMAFLSDDGGESYNRCHFWSNFEIADMDFWRSEAYTKFFDYLDEQGGFYYERWGDAPVHSIGAALFARKDQLHFFNDMGYRHEPFQHCPQGELHSKNRCWCDPAQNFGASTFRHNFNGI